MYGCQGGWPFGWRRRCGLRWQAPSKPATACRRCGRAATARGLRPRLVGDAGGWLFGWRREVGLLDGRRQASRLQLVKICRAATCARRPLRPGFSLSEMRAAGYWKQQREGSRLSMADAKQAGYSLSEMRAGGYRRKEAPRPRPFGWRRGGGLHGRRQRRLATGRGEGGYSRAKGACGLAIHFSDVRVAGFSMAEPSKPATACRRCARAATCARRRTASACNRRCGRLAMSNSGQAASHGSCTAAKAAIRLATWVAGFSMQTPSKPLVGDGRAATRARRPCSLGFNMSEMLAAGYSAGHGGQPCCGLRVLNIELDRTCTSSADSFTLSGVETRRGHGLLHLRLPSAGHGRAS